MSAHAARPQRRPRDPGAACAGVLWAASHVAAFGLLAQTVAHDLDRHHDQAPTTTAADAAPADESLGP